MSRKIRPAFPTHKVTLKSINIPPPSRALEYLLAKFEDVTITVDKQRISSITITFHCTRDVYERIKLYFVRDMGRDFIWKD